jgi:hypothetical protein
MNFFHHPGSTRGPGRVGCDDPPSATPESDFAVDPRANATRYADNEQAK